MRCSIVLILALCLLQSTVMASGPDTITTPVALATAQSVNPSSSHTSSTFTKLGNTKNQSALFIVAGTGGSPVGNLDVECSFDNTNFYTPTTGASVTQASVATAAGGGVIAPVVVPAVPYYRFKYYNTSATITATYSLTVLSQ